MTGPVVVLDLAAGQARVGGTVVAVSAEPGGGLRYGETSLRALGFGERWRLVAEQARELGRAVLASAAAPAPPGADQIAQVLALHLAGARTERTAPAFTAQLAALVATGWAPGEVLAAPADLIDLLTGTPNGQSRDDSESSEDQGWTRIVWGAVAAAPSPVVPEVAMVPDVAMVLRMLEADLLDRGAPAAVPGPAAVLPDHNAGWEPRPAAWQGGARSDEGVRAGQQPTPGDAPTPGREAPAAPAQRAGETTPEPTHTPNDPSAANPRPVPRDLTAAPPARPVAMPANGDPESAPGRHLPARPAASEVPAREWAPRPAAPQAPPGRGAGSPPVPIRDSWSADPHDRSGAAAALTPSWTAAQLAPPLRSALRTPEAASRTPEAADRIPAARVTALADLVAALLAEESDLRGLLP